MDTYIKKPKIQNSNFIHYPILFALPVKPLKYYLRITFLNALLMTLVMFSAISCAYGTELGKARFKWDSANDSRVTGYELHWGNESHIYTHSIDVGNATEVVIESFAEGVEYFAAVTAYDNSGQKSDFSVELSFVYDSIDKLIFIEAEEGEISPQMTVVGDESILWVAANNSDPDASVEMKFSVPFAEDYYVWCRVFAPDADTDSFYVSLDQNTEEEYYVYCEPNPPIQAIASEWTWSRIQINTSVPRLFTMEPGSHIIRFRNRENALLDRIVVTSSSAFIPTDLLPRSGDYIEIMRQPKDTTVIEGGTAVIDASLISTMPINIQWIHNGYVIENANQCSLNIMNVTAQASGEYMMIARGGTVLDSTRTAILTVYSSDPANAFRVLNINYLENGQVEFLTTNSIGKSVEIYASDDLLTWNLIPIQSKIGNTITINDSEAGARTKRFYRLVDKVSP